METKRELKDKQIICCECGQTFTWTAGDQFFYLTKHLQPVRRCPKCRAKRKATIDPGQMEGADGK